MQLKKYIMDLFGRVYNIIEKRLKYKCRWIQTIQLAHYKSTFEPENHKLTECFNEVRAIMVLVSNEFGTILAYQNQMSLAPPFKRWIYINMEPNKYKEGYNKKKKERRELKRTDKRTATG